MCLLFVTLITTTEERIDIKINSVNDLKFEIKIKSSIDNHSKFNFIASMSRVSWLVTVAFVALCAGVVSARFSPDW